jgi:4'-phosphopantetheinyl transferase
MYSKTPLSPADVHVWLCDLAVPGPALSRLEALLSPLERIRASQFSRISEGSRFVVSHGLLRAILGRYLGRESDALRFAASGNGKPFLSDPDCSWLDFNLSRSGDRMAVACARCRPVGVDIEEVARNDSGLTELVERNFSAAEQAEWRDLLAEERRAAFFRGWARKEAYLKALGVGLSRPMGTFSVRLGRSRESALLTDAGDAQAPSRWSLLDVSADPRWAAAVAFATGPEPGSLRVFRFEDEDSPG